MAAKHLSPIELDQIIQRELAACSDEQRAFFGVVAFQPTKWRQSPWGNESGGFWAVAVNEDRVLWYNEIEEGFNVSRFTSRGTIPDNEYWCNQDPLQ
jgi:hypothetical protein